jgi:hypothetical protein
MRRFGPQLVFLCLIVAAFGWSVPAAVLAPLPQPGRDYNTAGFLVRHSWVKFALVATDPLRADLSREEEDRRVARFFQLNALIAERERVAGEETSQPEARESARREAEHLRAERQALENSVEEILAGRLTSVLEDQGLTRRMGWDVVWPPVSIEFEDPPAVLVRSPRAEIRREGDRLLEGDLPVDVRVRLEADEESDGQTSALVIDIGAIAMYPAIVPPRVGYEGTLRTIAHEWVHHYLYFAPLGRSFFASDKLRTLNETVANIAGDEIGELMHKRYPLGREPALVRTEAAQQQTTGNGQPTASGRARAEMEQPEAREANFFAALRIVDGRLAHRTQEDERLVLAAASGGAESPPVLVPDDTFKAMTEPWALPLESGSQEEFDFGREMQALRLTVDELLAAGRIEEAELVMEERRKVFVAKGYYIRRINQAYFAFHGTYADTPASSDPIGPKMLLLRQRSFSIEEFLERAREITSETELDGLLVETSN